MNDTCKKISASWAQSNWGTNLSELSMCKAKRLLSIRADFRIYRKFFCWKLGTSPKSLPSQMPHKFSGLRTRVGQYLQIQIHPVVPSSFFRISIYHCSQTVSRLSFAMEIGWNRWKITTKMAFRRFSASLVMSLLACLQEKTELHLSARML